MPTMEFQGSTPGGDKGLVLKGCSRNLKPRMAFLSLMGQVIVIRKPLGAQICAACCILFGRYGDFSDVQDFDGTITLGNK